jgi:hypothetical protein
LLKAIEKRPRILKKPKQVTSMLRKKAMLSSSRKPADSAPEPADMQLEPTS